MTILIVDDDDFIVDGLCSIIKRFEIEPLHLLTAQNAHQALTIMKGQRIDLTISDIKMPGISGLELIKEAKKMEYCDRFLILTGFDEFEFAREAIRYGVIDYMLKPVDKEALREILTSVFSEKQQPERHHTHDVQLPIENLDSKCFSKPVHTILSYLEQNYMLDISLAHLSEAVSMHPNYICALLKKEIHHTFIEIRDMHRIKCAMQYLLDQKESIAKVGQRVGFNNETRFYKVFKRLTGFTPLHFREKYK